MSYLWVLFFVGNVVATTVLQREREFLTRLREELSLTAYQEFREYSHMYEEHAYTFLEDLPMSTVLDTRFSVLATVPLMVSMENFLSEPECIRAINLYKDWGDTNSYSGGFLNSTGDDTGKKDRHSRILELAGLDSLPWTIRDRLHDMFFKNLPRRSIEAPFIQHYDPGGFVKAHYDFGSHVFYERTYTVIMYLNTIEGGGYTSFPHLDVNIVPRQGRVLIWQNALAGSSTRPSQGDALTLHEGSVTPVDKYIMTSWVRDY